MSGSCRKTMERSRARSGRSRSGNRAGSGGYKNRLDRGAIFFAAQALLICSADSLRDEDVNDDDDGGGDWSITDGGF